MAMIAISAQLQVPADELVFSFDRSPGPGGQNVNKLNTRVELRFDVAASRMFSDEQKVRLRHRLAARLTAAGVLVVRSSRHRSQGRNREDCLAKLAAALETGLAPPPPLRRPTRPGRGAVRRRLQAKREQSERKARRRPGAE
jgi:ribosome-associated protein